MRPLVAAQPEWASRSVVSSLVVGAFVGIIGWITVTDRSNLAEVTGDIGIGQASIGIGLWLLAISAVAGLVGTGGLLTNRVK